MKKFFVNGAPAMVIPSLSMAVYVKPHAENNGCMHATNRAEERKVDPMLLSMALSERAEEIRDIAAAATITKRRQTVVFRWKERRQTIVVEIGKKGNMPTVGIVTFLDVFKERVHDGDRVFDCGEDVST